MARYVKVIELPEGRSNRGIVPLEAFTREIVKDVVVKVENGGHGESASIFEQPQEPLQAQPGDFWLTGD